MTPFVVAHRAGNDLAALRRAEQLPVRLIEADIRRFRGRLEVRHLKTLGPVPVLWDRWALRPGWAPRLELATLLRAGGDVPLLLDLKGRDPRLATELDPLLRDRPVMVCSRSWPLLAGLRSLPRALQVHSVGNRAQLAALLRGEAGRRLGGVSVHRRLLTPAVVDALHEHTDMVMTWPVATVQEATALGAWGVDGVITERFETLAPALAAGARVRAA